jgi:DNA repair exonuclease SbcCD ATPase subunit
MTLQDCLTYLNRSANHLSSAITGNLIEIFFSATKTLKSADEKPALVINVRNRTGARKFTGSSKGEAGVSNLIIAETLYSLGRLWQRVAYRWFDEAVNSQDQSVRGTVYGYIREQAKLHQQVNLVVDHSPDVEAYADSIILAEKSGAGFTTYRIV